MKAVEAEQEKLFSEEKRRIVVEALKGTVRAFKPQPLLKVFQEQFKVIRSRYKFFVANGDSCTGKTVWAKHITGNTAEVYYVNCASCPEPDLRLLKAHHKVILLDEASPAMILRQKLLIQGPPDFVSLGCMQHDQLSCVPGLRQWHSVCDLLQQVDLGGGQPRVCRGP